MASLAKWVGTAAMALMAAACSKPPVEPEPGVALALAMQRSAALSNIHYRLRFEIPRPEQEPVVGGAVIAFDLADDKSPLQLDFRQGESAVRSLRINGVVTACDCVNEHIVLPAAALHPGRNEVAVDFIAGDGALNRNPEFLYTLLVPDRARTVFPLFDQPDLKARFELTLVVPAAWRALANAPLDSAVTLEGRTEYRFATTDPISSYLFSFVAGEFQAITREVNGRPMTMLHRETDTAKVARNVDAIFKLHGDALAWLEDYTGIDYPFQKFDFVLIPGHPYGGMEHVGAIQYVASALLLDEEPTLTDRLERAHLIAHETAHMWFGDLVTMRWFDDVWTKEVFANFMADKIVNPGFPQVDHALNFLVNHYPGAYSVDRSEGANPIRQPLANLDQAGQLYGDIIYDKAPIMMRQLELIVGPDKLREGLAEYLRRFSHGNATWPDLIGILDALTAVDLATWSEVWVNTPGRPEFRLASPPGAAAVGGEALVQGDPAGLGRIWPQQFDMLELGSERDTRVTMTTAGAATPIPAPATDGPLALRLFNADGRGYGLFPANMAILQAWDRLQPVEKGSALVANYEQLLANPAADVVAYLGLLLDITEREQDPLLLELALGQLQYIYRGLLADPMRMALATVVEDSLWAATLAQPDSSSTKLVFRYFANLADSPARLGQVYDIWAGTLALDKLQLEEDDRIVLAQTLAIRLPGKSDGILASQLANTTNPDSRRRLEFIAPSLSPDEAVRDRFFESLKNVDKRNTERWVVEAVGNLHHPSRLGQSAKYVLPSLSLLQEIQVTGDIFFPSSWLRATLGNHTSTVVAQTVRDFLAARPDYNPQLRMKILQAADRVFRGSAIRAAQGQQPPAVDESR